MAATDLPAGVTEDAAVQYISSKVDANLAHLFQESGVPSGSSTTLVSSSRLCALSHLMKIAVQKLEVP